MEAKLLSRLFSLAECVLLVVCSSFNNGAAMHDGTQFGFTDVFKNSTIDPEVFMNTSQLITSKDYPCEEYDVTTQDGYILTVQRIPHGRSPGQHVPDTSRPVVYLQHGLLSSSADWVDNLVNQSLGFLLADAGFDVWLGNSRGNTYGLRHKHLTPSDDAFWDFSWDEMASFDLPATVNKALEVTGAKDLVYIGYSQGTQIAFAALSNNKTLASKIKLFVALAPVAYIKHLESPIKLLAPFANDLEFLFMLLGVRDFLPSTPLVKWLGRNVCDLEIPKYLCENILFLFGGYDTKHFNVTRIPVYIAHSPAGTSTRNMIHYAQGVRSGKFCKFDFGPEENQRKYNQTTPPEYNPKSITVPIALFSASRDWLSVPSDVNTLVAKLRHVVMHNIISDWEHLDFTWAMNAPSACYNDIIRLIKTYNNMV